MQFLMRHISLYVVLLMAVSCFDSQPRTVDLNDEYSYYAHAGIVFIGRSDSEGASLSIVIPVSIDRIATEKNYAFGRLIPYPHELAGTKTPESARGYFYLNLKTGTKEIGMPQKKWESFLFGEGIKAPISKLKSTLY